MRTTVLVVILFSLFFSVACSGPSSKSSTEEEQAISTPLQSPTDVSTPFETNTPNLVNTPSMSQSIPGLGLPRPTISILLTPPAQRGPKATSSPGIPTSSAELANPTASNTEPPVNSQNNANNANFVDSWTLTDEWIDPNLALNRALVDLGIPDALNDPIANDTVPFLALGWKGLYGLETAPLGSWNGDTTGYYEWFKNRVADWFGLGSSDGDRSWVPEHVTRQFVTSIEQPNTEVGQVVRFFEGFAESQIAGSGPQEYWWMLYGPHFVTHIPALTMWEGTIREFFDLIDDYTNAKYREPSLTDFGTYLATVDYLPYSGTTSTPAPTNTPIPRPTATQRPTAGIPAEGQVLYDRPLNEWRTLTEDNGWFQTTDTTLQMGVYCCNGQRTLSGWTNQDDFGNISVSVDVREVSTGTDAVGCVSLRHDTALGDYSLCILADGRTWAIYDYIDGNGVWQTEVLLESTHRAGLTTAKDWVNLKIIANGNQFWFFANNQQLGAVTHNGRSSGSAALHVVTWDMDTDAIFEFKNLIVRTVQ